MWMCFKKQRRMYELVCFVENHSASKIRSLTRAFRNDTDPCCALAFTHAGNDALTICSSTQHGSVSLRNALVSDRILLAL